MPSEDFIKFCKDKLTEHYLDVYKGEDAEEIRNRIFVVWYCKTIQNHKAILGALLPDVNIYEFTYNGNEQEVYMDCYQKFKKKTFKV